MIFVDAGAFLGLYNTRDQYHRVASEGWDKLRKQHEIIVTSNWVLNEILTLLARRAGYSIAAERAHAVYLSSYITILRSSHEDELEAISLLEKFADQGVGFSDCVSFVLMRKRHIQTVFSFDRHFTFAGFELWP